MSWRLGELGPDATELAQAAAVLGDGCSLHQAAELAHLDEAVAVHEAARLEVASVLAHGDPIEFLHPLLRAAVEAELPDVVSGELHARAARILWYTGEDPASVAQHLMASPGLRRRRGVGVPLRAGAGRTRGRVGRGGHRACCGALSTSRHHPTSATASCCGSGAPSTWRWTSTPPASTSRRPSRRRDRTVALEAAGDLFDVLDDANLYDEIGPHPRGRVWPCEPFGGPPAEVIVQACLLSNVIMSLDAGSR